MSEDFLSVIAALGIIALAYRWFTTATAATSNGSNSAGSLTLLQRRAMSLPRAQVDRLLTMFPQLTENEVRYALVVTRGGVEAVAERVLIRGGLDPPPPHFFPQPNTPPATSQSASNNGNNSTTSTSSQINPPKTNPSLITKFGLQSYKLDQDQAEQENRDWNWEESRAKIEDQKSQGVPSDDEMASSSSLRDRKAKMILESRWKLLQKQKKGKGVAVN